MLIQEKIGGSDTLLKLYTAIDDDLKALQPQLQARQLPRDARGGTPTLSAAEVLTILVWGAWRGLRVMFSNCWSEGVTPACQTRSDSQRVL